VEGTVGIDKLLVFFTEGVYTNTGQTGALEAADFSLTDSDNARTILSVEHEAGTSAAILTLSSALDGSNDIGVDALAAVSNEIFSLTDDPAGTASLIITGNNCPVGGSRFDFGEPAESASVTDDTGLLIGTVGNPTFSMLGNDLYTGDSTEAEMTYIDVDNTNVCLKTPRALTLESKFYMGDIDLDYVDIMPENDIDDDYDAGGPTSRDGDGRNRTGMRMVERKRSFQFTIYRGNWSGDEIESRMDMGKVIFKYLVTDRGYCNGSYPGDPTVGDGDWWKQVSSDDAFPIITGHWYIVRIVFNTDKPRLTVDIFADDLGTDGSGTGELWVGYKNITNPDPEESAGCKWAAIPGLIMETEDQYLYIGDNSFHARPGQDDQGDHRNNMLKGKIDWFSWKPVADYTGVDDPPY